MTVRAWVTISAACLLALVGALAWQFLRPLEAPQLIARSAEQELSSAFHGSCWPQQTGELHCRPPADSDPGSEVRLPSSGSIRIIAVYPVQPEDGSVHIFDERTGETVLEEEDGDGWPDRVSYTLDAGTYHLEAAAGYPNGGWVRYRFGFTVEAEDASGD